MLTRRLEEIALLALLVFATLSTIAGGIALITGTIDFPTDWLNGTIFSSYVVPGIILAVVVGGSQAFALSLVYARGEQYLYAAALAGAVLMGWIIGEIIAVGSRDIEMSGYQLIFFIVGFLEFALASLQLRRGQPNR